MRYGFWLLAASAFAAGSIHAQVVDSTFGTGGHAVLQFGSASTEARGALLQSDGKIVVVGSTPVPNYGQVPIPRDSTRDFLVARYNADGTPDTGFAGDGILTIDFNGGDDRGFAIAQQSDGKLVVAGYGVGTSGMNDFDFAVARLLPDGSLDTAFNGTGKANVNFTYVFDSGIAIITVQNQDDCASSMVIEPNGKILIGGVSCSPNSNAIFALARLLPDGSPDADFGPEGNGQNTGAGLPFGLTISNMALDPAGAVFIAFGASSQYAWLEPGDSNININLATDPLTMPADILAFGKGPLLRQADGNWLVGGLGFRLTSAAPDDFFSFSPMITRVGPDLLTDTGFASSGFFVDDRTPYDGLIKSLLLEPVGKILAGGYTARDTGNDSVQDASVLRLDADGELDSNFGTDGLMTIDFSEGGSTYSFISASLLRAADGRLIVVGNRGVLDGGEGRTFVPSSQRVVLARVRSTPEFSFSQASMTVSEGAGSVAFNVTRVGTTNGTVSVDFATSAGTAGAPSDFTGSSGTLTWQPGDADTKTITVSLANDSTNESNEEFTVRLSNPSEGSIDQGAATATVTDDDPKKGGGGGAVDWWILAGLLLGWMSRGRRIHS